jgi:hypothetical protein
MMQRNGVEYDNKSLASCSIKKHELDQEEDVLEQACERIAKLKDWIDLRLIDNDVINKYLLNKSDFNGIRNVSDRAVVSGDVFASFVIPFCEPAFEWEHAVLEDQVNPFRVLAGRYLDGYPSLTCEGAAEKADGLDDATRSGRYSQSRATCTKLGPFNLYVGAEGKNRVSLYRRLGRDMVEHVFVSDFPKPNELLLHKIKPWNDLVAVSYTGTNTQFCERIDLLARLGKNLNIALLPYHESIELFKAYKVNWGKPIWALWSPIQARKIRLKISHSLYQANFSFKCNFEF